MSDSRGTILLADDTAFFRKYLGQLLRGDGYEVVEAADGAELLAQLEEHGHRLSLILTDVVMPKGNAFGLLPIIREKYSSEELPVLVISELAKPEDAVELRKLGADGFVPKQAPAEQVLFRVRQATQGRSARGRGAARALADGAVRYQAGELSGLGRLFNISRTGLYVISLSPPPPVGSSLELFFVLPGGDLELRVSGRVVRVSQPGQSPRSAEPPGFAVALDQLSAEPAQALDSYLTERSE